MEDLDGKSAASNRNIKVTLLQIFMLNSIVCGLEFCASAAFTYIPPMLLKAGLKDNEMSFVLGIGPFLGFFFVPMIGHSSDQCMSRFGRRRPFILGLSLILIISLVIVPYGLELGQHLLKSQFGAKLGVLLLIIGAIALDFSTQATLTPCEALLSDATKGTHLHERAFTVYSFMVSAGGIVGYLITAIDWRATPIGIFFGTQEHACFMMLIILFSISLFLTLFVGQEKPKRSVGSRKSVSKAPSVPELLQPLRSNDIGYESGSYSEDELENKTDELNIEAGIHRSFVGNFAFRIPFSNWTVKLSNCTSFFRLMRLRVYRKLPQNIKILLEMPAVLRRLALANFFSWTAVMGFNLFFTDFMGQFVYGGNPNAPEDSPLRELYDDGVRMGSWGLLFHCLTSAVYAAVVEQLSALYGLKITYFIGLMSFTLAMVAMTFIRAAWFINFIASLTGIGYATLTTVPFMLITSYHEDRNLYFFDIKSSLPSRGIGTDLAALDSAYFLSQVLLSAIMGNLVHLTGTVVTYVIVSAAMGAVACACISRIIFTKQQVQNMILVVNP